MNPLRSPTLRFVLWLLLVLVSLRPVGAVDEVMALAAAPARVLGELAPRAAWVQRGEVRAAEQRVASTAEEDARSGRDLHRDLVELALPTRAELLERAELARGDVLRYTPGDRDRIEVQLTELYGVRVGCPVVTGNAYVGRVAAIDRETVRVEVQLITGRDVFVGARLVGTEAGPRDAPVRMTVGGVDTVRPGGAPYLAVHNPSDRDLGRGLVVVHEERTDLDPLGPLANGFELGRLALGPGGRPVAERPLLVPRLDYKSGLYQVVVLLDPDPDPSSAAPPVEGTFEDRRWIRVRPLSSGDPSPWRAGLKVAPGREAGLRPGAALVSGARLFGRLVRVGWASADVALLGDPGLSLVCAARIEGLEEPVVLGEVVSRGSAGGTPRFAWTPQVPLGIPVPPEGLSATLFTSAGQEGLPAGIVIGPALLRPPASGEPRGVHELELLAEVDPRYLRDVWVRAVAQEDRR